METGKNTLNLSDIPSNSNKNKNEVQMEKKEVPKNIAPSVTEGVTLKKKSFGSKLKNSMVAEDISTVGSYIAGEVIVPTLKELLYNIVAGSLESLMWGTTRGKRSSGHILKGRGKIDYTQFQYDSIGGGSKKDLSHEHVKKIGGFDFDVIIFDDRATAKKVLDDMLFFIEEYDRVSVNDLFDLCNKSKFVPPTATHYGWTDLRGVQPKMIRGGKFILDLPDPEVLPR